jgi:PEP-CTERM motif
MRCTYRWQLLAVAVAIVGMVGASSAFADPYSPSVAEIQALNDNTGEFSQDNQLSTVEDIHIAPDGIHVDVIWRRGQNQSSFDPYFGEGFSRIVLRSFQNGEDGGAGRLLFPGYDGIKWCVMSDLGVGAQPFIQTAPGYSYFQPTNDTPVPGDMSNTMATISFNDVKQDPGMIPLDDNNEIRSYAWGLQLFGPFPDLGVEVPGHIWIKRWVPEPSSAVLLLMGAVGLVGRVRRRQ